MKNNVQFWYRKIPRSLVAIHKKIKRGLIDNIHEHWNCKTMNESTVTLFGLVSATNYTTILIVLVNI